VAKNNILKKMPQFCGKKILIDKIGHRFVAKKNNLMKLPQKEGLG
jgi:hypothetical protein